MDLNNHKTLPFSLPIKLWDEAGKKRNLLDYPASTFFNNLLQLFISFPMYEM